MDKDNIALSSGQVSVWLIMWLLDFQVGKWIIGIPYQEGTIGLSIGRWTNWHITWIVKQLDFQMGKETSEVSSEQGIY